MRKVHADARTCYSSLKLSDLVGYLDATDRVPVRTEVAVHIGVAAAEAEAVSAVAVAVDVVRSGRPIVAVVASIVGIAVVVVAVASSREEHLGIFINRNIIFYI